MLALQWVAIGVVVVLLDLVAQGWDLLPDPLGWLLVLVGLSRLRERLGTTPLVATAVALPVSVATFVPGLVRTDEPALAWGLSLPQVLTLVVIALAVGEAVPERRRALRLCAWLLAGVGVAPVLVLGGGAVVSGLLGLVGLLAFVAVLAQVWLVPLLLLSAPALEPVAGPVPDAREGRP